MLVVNIKLFPKIQMKKVFQKLGMINCVKDCIVLSQLKA